MDYACGAGRGNCRSRDCLKEGDEKYDSISTLQKEEPLFIFNSTEWIFFRLSVRGHVLKQGHIWYCALRG